MHKESAGQPRLRDQFRNAIRVRHYSIRTEKTYWYWIRYFIRFHKLKHPLTMAEQDVSAFLTWLATESGRRRRNTESGTQCACFSVPSCS